MKTTIKRTIFALLLATVLGSAEAQDLQQQLADDPVAQACRTLAEAGNETAAKHFEAIKRQLRATAETREEGAPEGRSVRDFQQIMREAAEARAWCGAVPIQTSPGAPAHTDDPEIPKEWVRQSMLSSYSAKDCDRVLDAEQSGQAYDQCRKMRRQLDEWDSYYDE
ncbi:hypothetical protein H0Z60_15485 [Ectothiorhodospiraceae bacterium WFHF3C12]|nr:hypothetical protein [Ectothiorhodospiraceae bacterium WFHF3C12]